MENGRIPRCLPLRTQTWIQWSSLVEGIQELDCKDSVQYSPASNQLVRVVDPTETWRHAWWRACWLFRIQIRKEEKGDSDSPRSNKHCYATSRVWLFEGYNAMSFINLDLVQKQNNSVAQIQTRAHQNGTAKQNHHDPRYRPWPWRNNNPLWRGIVV